MHEKLITQLNICRLSDIKPNFAELGREYDLDWRTVKKYYDGYSIVGQLSRQKFNVF